METLLEKPVREGTLKRLLPLLAQAGLRWDPACQSTVALLENDQAIATGSRDGDTLKCIAAAPHRQGEGLMARVVTELVKDALRAGVRHLFLFTKPENVTLFRELGFYPLAATDRAALLENRRDGLAGFLAELEKPPAGVGGIRGAIVANANPFTNGHLYLVETAAKSCDFLHLFILSQEQSSLEQGSSELRAFPAAERLALARAATGHIPNLLVHPTGPYMVSAVTFPDYFLKDPACVPEAAGELDLRLFAQGIAGPLGITRRFVGTEPLSPITRAYNEQMKALLPGYGIDVVELARREQGGGPISASRVRALLREQSWEALAPLVPPATYKYLRERRHEEP